MIVGALDCAVNAKYPLGPRMCRPLALFLCLTGCTSALKQVIELEDRRAGEEVAAFVSSSDPEVRRRALLAVGRTQDPRSVPVLVTALADREVVGEAAFAAGLLGLSWQPLDDAAKDQLVSALVKAEYHPRVTQALGRLGTPAAVAKLTELLRDDPLAALALGIAVKRGAKVDDPVIALVEPLVAHGNERDARYSATYLLAMLKRPAAVPALLVAAEDGDAEIRALAAKGLGDAGAVEPAKDKLTRALEDGDVRVAVEAARALIKLKVEPLPKLDGRPQLLLAAAQAGVAVETDDPKLKCRMAIARDKKAGKLDESLGCGPLALHEVGAAPPEEKLSSTSSAELLGALDAVGASKAAHLAPKVRPLVESEDHIVAAGAAVALAKLGDREAIPAIRALARSVLAHEDIAPSVADALAELDAKEAVPELTAWLASRNATVRHSAAAALTKLTGSKVTAPEVALAEADPLPQTGSKLVITTERGDVEIELWNDEHPRTAGNLWSLAKRGYFDGLTFHRIVPDFVAQGGDPRGDGEGGPGYMIRCEIGRRPFVRGTVGMALSGKDTGGSQFFITHTATPHLDGRYTAFGQVKSGMEHVDALLEGDRMLKVTALP